MKLPERLLSLILLLALSLPLLANETNEAVKNAVQNPARSDADLLRDKTSKPLEILTFSGVKPGMTVLDLFSGGGYYTELLSYAVGSNGQVYSQNNKAYENFAGKDIEARYRGNRLPSVTLITSEFENLKLPDNTFDLILMSLSYHDIYYVADYWPAVNRDHFFKQLNASLKTGGALVIIDHAATEGSGKTAVQELHRIDEDFAKQDIEKAGFVFQAASGVLRNPEDPRTLNVFDENIRRKTDRFVYLFTKP